MRQLSRHRVRESSCETEEPVARGGNPSFRPSAAPANDFTETSSRIQQRIERSKSCKAGEIFVGCAEGCAVLQGQGGQRGVRDQRSATLRCHHQFSEDAPVTNAWREKRCRWVRQPFGDDGHRFGSREWLPKNPAACADAQKGPDGRPAETDRLWRRKRCFEPAPRAAMAVTRRVVGVEENVRIEQLHR